MQDKLNENFSQWLDEISQKWGMPKEKLHTTLASEEIGDRVGTYPSLAESLRSIPFDVKQFASIFEECNASGTKFDLTRFNRFIYNTTDASAIILKLIKKFPQDDDGSIDRINAFIDDCVKHKYTKKTGSPDRAGAASLGSIILTSLYPDRFVDFRPERWKTFSERFEYTAPFPEKQTYGEQIIWAGKFAHDLSLTPVFNKYLPDSEPLWVVAGLCWKWNRKLDTTQPKPDDEPIEMGYPEGEERKRTRSEQKRNRKVIDLAKGIRKKTDPSLKCEVCHFSFIDTYGIEYIVGHHQKEQIASRKGIRFTTYKDIALVCSNCHTVIHSKEPMLTLAKVKEMLGQSVPKK